MFMGRSLPRPSGDPAAPGSLDASERRLEVWLRAVPFALLIMSMIP
jgi:hypothetical protein